jgi:hypothetical protein
MCNRPFRGKRASIAYVIATVHAGQGLAAEATTAMCDTLRERLEVTELVARIHPGHRASQQVASHVGLSGPDGPTRTVRRSGSFACPGLGGTLRRRRPMSPHAAGREAGETRRAV